MKATFTMSLFFLLLITACGPSRSDFDSLWREAESLRKVNQDLQAEIAALTKENEKLKADFEAIYLAPQRLLSQSQTKLQERQYTEAKANLEAILQKYPASCVVCEAQSLLEKVNQAIKGEATATEAQQRQAEAADQKRIAAATSQMRKVVDAVRDLTWYEDKNTPQNNNVNKLYLFMGIKKGSTPRLQIAMHVVAKNWLLIDAFTVIADDKKYESGPIRFERGDVGAGFIFEYVNKYVEPQEKEWIQAVIVSKKAVIQYHGEQVSVEREITPAQKKSLQNVLDVFAVLGGKV